MQTGSSYEANDGPPDDDGTSQAEEDDDEVEEEAFLPNSEGGGGGGGGANHRNHLSVTALPTLDRLSGLRELGCEAVCWQLSSAKPGNGVEQIRDPCLETYWQSDGQTQPHWIQIHFARRVAVSHVCLYLDYHLDESYTPKKVAVHAGMTHQDLLEAVAPVELQEPSGWCILPLRAPPDPLEDDLDDDDGAYMDDDEENHVPDPYKYNHKHVVRAHLIRVSIQSMHQNGRDTHVRHVRIYGPRMTAQFPDKNVTLQSDSDTGDCTIGIGGNWTRSTDSIHATRFTTIR